MTWTTVAPDPTVTNFVGLAISEDNAQHIYVSGVGDAPGVFGVWHSHDIGQTWAHSEIAPGVVPLALACSADGSRVLTLGGDGPNITPWYSTDYGSTWVEGTGVVNTSSASNPGSVYMSADGMTCMVNAGFEDIWMSYDGAATWVTRPPTQTGATGCAGSNDASVLMTSDGDSAPNISTDNGTSFIPVTGIPAGSVFQPAIKGDGSRLYLTEWDNGDIYVSTNGGTVWDLIADAEELYEVACPRTGPNVVITTNAGPYDKVYRSTDDLATYAELPGMAVNAPYFSRIAADGSVVMISGDGTGLVWLWLEEPPPPVPVNPYPVSLPSPCPCGDQWRIEGCDLSTGIVRSVLRPVGADWQTVLNNNGRGSMTFPAQAIQARDVWPDLTSVYITRTPSDGGEVTVEWAGIVTAFQVQGGTVSVGMDSIESYLNRRLTGDVTFTSAQQTQIAAALVNQANPDGIPLTSAYDPSATVRDRAYADADDLFIGPMLQELATVEGGVSWRLVHTKTGGAWSTQIRFSDTVGSDTDGVYWSDREGSAYGLTVDAAGHATHVRGNTDPLTANATDYSVYPRFDAVQDFNGITDQTNLDNQTAGFLGVVKEPTAQPAFTISGPFPHPSDLRLGDTAEFHIDQDACRFDGRARVQAITWRIAEGAPETRELALVPLVPASQSVMNA